MEHYFNLVSLSSDPCNVDKQWYQKATQDWICPNCHSIRSKNLKHIYLANLPDDSSLNIVHGINVNIVSMNLINTLSKLFVEKYFEIGDLFFSDGTSIENFKSLKGIKSKVLIRGNNRSSFSICFVCDNLNYFPMGKPYIISSDINNEPISDSQLGLIVRNDIFDVFGKNTKKKLGVRKLTVRLNPIDDLEHKILESKSRNIPHT